MVLYDNFINSQIIYDHNDLLDELEELEISFINDQGKLFNFEKSEHSFVLELQLIITLKKIIYLKYIYYYNNLNINTYYFIFMDKNILFNI